MMIDVLTLAIGLAAILLSSIAAYFSIRNYIELEAMKRSTHQIQFMPADELESFKMTDEDVAKNQANDLSEDELKALTKDPFEEL